MQFPVKTLRSSRSIAFLTLGCAKNEVDTTQMRRRVSAAGYALADSCESSDAIVLNTCSFIEAATEESIETVFELLDFSYSCEKHPIIVVAGCMPARYGKDLNAELTEIDHFLSCADEGRIVEVLDDAFNIEEPCSLCGSAPSADESAVFAYVKIGEGCDRRCSFCVIPDIRGSYRSFPYDSIREEVEYCVSRGAREINLIAQDTGRWGSDFSERSSLSSLLDALASEFAEVWFRLLYLEPDGVTEDLLETMSRHANICPYLDVPLQHVNQDVLRSMNRKGSVNAFNDMFKMIFSYLPHATLRTTLIAGFPGESEDQFEELLSFVEDSPFSYIGVFPYSREEGTPAFDLPGQIEEDEKLRRAQELRDTADAVCAARISQRIGSRVEVLIEGYEEDGQPYGRTQSQAPDVDGVTYVDGAQAGDIVSVTVIDTLMYEMEGEL